MDGSHPHLSMNPLRTCIASLGVAALAGSLSLVPEDFWISVPTSWDGALRGLCIAGLVAFAITFIISLDRRSLVKS